MAGRHRADRAGRPDAAAPQGREQIPAALISACERLCSTRPPSRVSVRDIAREARVTTGLVHHYFESKDALMAATLRTIAEGIATAFDEALAETGEVGEAARAVWRFGAVRPAFMMIALDWLVQGKDPTGEMGDHPYLRTLAGALGGPERPEAADDAAVIALVTMAGVVLHPGFSRAIGREPGDPRVSDAIEDALVLLARSAQERSREEA